MVPDVLGLGRIPGCWTTVNPKYNAVFDVQRLNADMGLVREALTQREDAHARVRFAFTRDRPDLVTHQVAIRTELTFRMAMASVVPHGPDAPFLPLWRFEAPLA